MKKNDTFIGICVNYTHDGHGVVKCDGFPFFVKGMIKGEEGKFVVTRVKKHYGFARLLERYETSKERVTPPCPIAQQCGGCQLQHMSYKAQLAYKKQKVQDVMERIAKLDIPVHDVLGMKEYTNYRNKGQIPVGVDKNQKVVTGFYRMNSNDIIDMHSCMIQSTKINEVLQVMRSLLETYGNARVFRHILIKHAFATDELMVVWIVCKAQFEYKEKMKTALVKAIPSVKSIIVNINTRDDNVILGDREELLYGTRYITDSIHDLKFHISSKSFYQVNPMQTEILYGKVLDYCQLTGNEMVMDLYCGVGTISMFLAKKAKRVIGIEIVPQAIADAKENAKVNGLSNITFICSDAASYAKKLCGDQVQLDVIVVDPPRKGCDESTLASIVEMHPSRIVYVSCDPATLARDLRILESLGYQTEEVQPTDMFPYSFHVETVVRLSRTK